MTRARTPSGGNFSTLEGHRSLADLGFSADSLRNRSHELVRSEAMHEIASLYLRRPPTGAG
jgi:hypothetical protein